MKYGYRETRRISAIDIRHLCIMKKWFTNGNIKEYGELLDYGNKNNITSDELVEMATLIKMCIRDSPKESPCFKTYIETHSLIISFANPSFVV